MITRTLSPREPVSVGLPIAREPFIVFDGILLLFRIYFHLFSKAEKESRI